MFLCCDCGIHTASADGATPIKFVGAEGGRGWQPCLGICRRMMRPVSAHPTTQICCHSRSFWVAMNSENKSGERKEENKWGRREKCESHL